MQKSLAKEAKKALDQVDKTARNAQLIRDVNADLAPDLDNQTIQTSVKTKEKEIPIKEKHKTSTKKSLDCSSDFNVYF